MEQQQNQRSWRSKRREGWYTENWKLPILPVWPSWAYSSHWAALNAAAPGTGVLTTALHGEGCDQQRAAAAEFRSRIFLPSSNPLIFANACHWQILIGSHWRRAWEMWFTDLQIEATQSRLKRLSTKLRNKLFTKVIAYIETGINLRSGDLYVGLDKTTNHILFILQLW